MNRREKFVRALREGRILRDARGRFVIPEVVRPGVVLTPTGTLVTTHEQDDE